MQCHQRIELVLLHDSRLRNLFAHELLQAGQSHRVFTQQVR